MDVLADGAWEKIFKVKPEVFTREEKRAWLDQMKGVTLGSLSLLPVVTTRARTQERRRSTSQSRADRFVTTLSIECCNKYNMAMAFTGIRLFHH